MKKEDLLQLGFEPIPNYTVMDTLIYKLQRNRHISISNIDTPNEVVYICQVDVKYKKKITDLVCIHNYDYDGYVSLVQMKIIIRAMLGKAIDNISTINEIAKNNCFGCNMPLNSVGYCTYGCDDEH